MLVAEDNITTAMPAAWPALASWMKRRRELVPHPPSERALAWQGGLLLALFSGVLLFARLDYPLLEPDESRYAVIPLVMLQDGDWIVPHHQGKAYNDKPPLTYWLVALSYRLFGVHEWSARLVPALAAWLTILAAYGWACRWCGWRPAFLGAGILATCGGFLVMGRMLLLDGVLTLWVTLALWTGHTALARSRLDWRWWLASAACAGLGILTKGPVALVLVVPCLAAYRWLDPRSARWRPGHWLAYGCVALAIALPWYVAVMSRSENFAGEFFWRHHLMRFLKPYHHLRPWWFYVPVLAAELLPWTILLPMWLWRRIRVAGAERSEAPDSRQGSEHSAPTTDSATFALRYCAFGAAWCLFFFSVSACKLPTYLMPMLPLAAILLGHYVYHRRLRRLWLGCLALGSAALAGGLWWCMPYYAAKASAGDTAARLAVIGDELAIPVIAFRDDWDAAAFYRGGRELPVFPHENAVEFVATMRQQSQTLVLVRESGQHRDEELQRLLPPDLCVLGAYRAGRVTGLLVRRQDG